MPRLPSDPSGAPTVQVYLRTNGEREIQLTYPGGVRVVMLLPYEAARDLLRDVSGPVLRYASETCAETDLMNWIGDTVRVGLYGGASAQAIAEMVHPRCRCSIEPVVAHEVGRFTPWATEAVYPSPPPAPAARHPRLTWRQRCWLSWPQGDTTHDHILYGCLEPEVQQYADTQPGWSRYLALRFWLGSPGDCADLADRLVATGHGTGWFFYGDNWGGTGAARAGDAHLAWFVPLAFAVDRQALSVFLRGVVRLVRPRSVAVSQPRTMGARYSCNWLTQLGSLPSPNSWLHGPNRPDQSEMPPLADRDPRDWSPDQLADRGNDLDPDRRMPSLLVGAGARLTT